MQVLALTDRVLVCHVSVLRMSSTSLNRKAEVLTADFTDDTDKNKFHGLAFRPNRAGASQIQARLYPCNPRHPRFTMGDMSLNGKAGVLTADFADDTDKNKFQQPDV